ncbi:MAG: hypothetical protein IJI26_06765 [Clostridia bacterium]|nr:hypothetical protein [Clostridia bacterium]
MQHNLRISVSRKPQTGGVIAIRNVALRERLLRFLLGEKRRLTILVPGDTVSDIEINEVKDGGNDDETV